MKLFKITDCGSVMWVVCETYGDASFLWRKRYTVDREPDVIELVATENGLIYKRTDRD